MRDCLYLYGSTVKLRDCLWCQVDAEEVDADGDGVITQEELAEYNRSKAAAAAAAEVEPRRSVGSEPEPEPESEKMPEPEPEPEAPIELRPRTVQWAPEADAEGNAGLEAEHSVLLQDIESLAATAALSDDAVSHLTPKPRSYSAPRPHLILT